MTLLAFTHFDVVPKSGILGVKYDAVMLQVSGNKLIFPAGECRKLQQSFETECTQIPNTSKASIFSTCIFYCILGIFADFLYEKY